VSALGHLTACGHGISFASGDGVSGHAAVASFALRTLRKDSGFAAFAILIIALGIGASSTVFSVLDALLVKPLPFKDPGRLVWIANRTRIDGDLSGAT
jgi:hypothetical protein